MSENLTHVGTVPSEEGESASDSQVEPTSEDQEPTSGDRPREADRDESLIAPTTGQQTPSSTTELQTSELLTEEELPVAKPQAPTATESAAGIITKEPSSSVADEATDHEVHPTREDTPEKAQGDEARAERTGMGKVFTDDYTYRRPKRGEIRQGQIIGIEEDHIIVDLGLKREGHVSADDLQRVGSDIVAALSLGDEIPVYVIRPEDREGNIVVSWHRARQEQDWLDAQRLHETGEVWEGKVKGYNRGGLIVPYGKIRGFVPASHLTGMSRRLDPATLQARLADIVGKSLPLKVIEVDRRRRRLIFSERLARRAWRLQQREKLLNELQEGDHVHGVVSNVCDFGVFVDIGGTDGLVHISELSWRRTRHPSELIKVGDEVEVYVLHVDRERKRIGLSLRLIEADPWEAVEEKYEVGQLVTGVITKITDFGAFAALDDDIEGLIHISELAEVPPKHPSEVVTGDKAVPLRIVKIDSRRRRMGLSLKRVSEEDWAEWEEQRKITVEPEEQVEAAGEPEPPVQEALVEEPQVAPLTAEEAPAEVVAEEPPDEALPTEEAPVEPMAEEPRDEALPAEEAPVEPVAEEPRDEALSTEEAPVEPVAEEPPDQALTAEEALVEPVAEEPRDEALPTEEAPVEPVAEELPDQALTGEEAPVEPVAEEPRDEALPTEEAPAEPVAEEPRDEALPTEETPVEPMAEEPRDEALPAEEAAVEPVAEEPRDEALPAEEAAVEPVAEEPRDEALPTEEAPVEPPDEALPKGPPPEDEDSLWDSPPDDGHSHPGTESQ